MKFLCFDAESDGLYGDIFAIGAVVIDGDKEIDNFNGFSQISNVTDKWVIQNVLPFIKDMKEYDTRYELRQKFWEFYMEYKEDCLIVADCPYPVEYNLLKQCVEDNYDDRKWLGPYPIIDVASVLFSKGIDPLKERIEIIGKERTIKHNPLEDARISARVLIDILRL